jgi:purine-binding chemotaxis protein CheW
MTNSFCAQPGLNECGVKQYATFEVGGLFFGVEVVKVQEVLRYQSMTKVPLTPPVIEGLINLRGQIVTAIDMRARLRMPPRKQDELPMNIVLRSDDGAVSLLVDEIGDVIEVDQSSWEPAPEHLAPEQRKLIRGLHKLNRNLLLVLDTERTLEIPKEAEG